MHKYDEICFRYIYAMSHCMHSINLDCINIEMNRFVFDLKSDIIRKKKLHNIFLVCKVHNEVH